MLCNRLCVVENQAVRVVVGRDGSCKAWALFYYSEDIHVTSESNAMLSHCSHGYLALVEALLSERADRYCLIRLMKISSRPWWQLQGLGFILLF